MTMPPRRTPPATITYIALLFVSIVTVVHGFVTLSTSEVAFVASSRRFSLPPPSTADGMHHRIISTLLYATEDSSWEDEHMIHGASEIREETDDELKEAEEMAVWDAFDAASDPGMEAASEERAVMLANEMAHKLKEQASKQTKQQEENEWNKEHLIHGAGEIHEETDEELAEAEAEAAWDAHDCSDPGMEAAMMERSVMLANEMAHKMKEKAKHANDASKK